MTEIEIEYCVPCGLLDPAVTTQRELLETFGRDLDSVRLTPSHGGVFNVFVDGEKIWDKDEDGGELDFEVIVSQVEHRASAQLRRIKEKARADEAHRAWLTEHTETGTLAQIRAALRGHTPSVK